jgi:hypothetical protein
VHRRSAASPGTHADAFSHTRTAIELARGDRDRCRDDPRSTVSEYIVEAAGDLAVAVAAQKFDAAGVFGETQEKIASPLGGPRPGWNAP